jgi:regulator of replication initiation timing
MPDFYTILSIISLILTIGGLLGGVFAFKNGMTRTANEVQERVIHALESEISNLRQRLDDMKEENIRLKLVIETVCTALKSRGLAVTIDGAMVSIHDTHGTTTITHIQEREEPLDL